MQRSDAVRVFDTEFCGRYDVAVKNKEAMAMDWVDAIAIFSIDIAKQAIKNLYENSRYMPSIADFKKTAFEIAKKNNKEISKPKDDYVQSDYFIQLCGSEVVIGRDKNDKPIIRKTDLCLGQFKRVSCFASENPTPERLSCAAENLKKRLIKIYGGDWQVIDYSCEFSGEDNRDTRIMESIYGRKEKLHLRQKHLCQGRR